MFEFVEFIIVLLLKIRCISTSKDGLPSMLKPKPKFRAMPTSAVPKAAPKFNNMERPRFLPEPGAPELMGGTYGNKFKYADVQFSFEITSAVPNEIGIYICRE